MLSKLFSPFKKIIYKDLGIKAFIVTRLHQHEIIETVFLRSGEVEIDITRRHSMICLDPFCVAIWLTPEQLTAINADRVMIFFKNGKKINAGISLNIIESISVGSSVLLLYKAVHANNYQLNAFYRFLTLSFFLKNKTSTYQQRKFIAALYSYPRKVIAVSYKEPGYCNIFPMDIQGYIAESGFYILGLRTSNIVLDKILATKKLVVSDTDQADVSTIYSLGKHLSVSPPAIETLPFTTSNSELHGFPVPGFAASYKELEIIESRKLGYHMLLVAKVINAKELRKDPSSIYHAHIFQFVKSGYKNITEEVY
ncbi:MAG: hypothetical protein ABJA78_02180 [Ferruginibacter sp.]